MKSVLIIGMGRFGHHLAKKLILMGNDVMVVDKDEDKIEDLEGEFTDSFIGDCTNKGVVRSLGVSNFDVCFVAIDQDFEASLVVTSHLKEMGAKYIVSNANRDRQAEFLTKIGADEVIFPEREIAEKTAVRFNSSNLLDYIELSDGYAVCELSVCKKWVGKTIASINVRNKYNVNIIAVKNTNSFTHMPPPDYIFQENDVIVVIGLEEDTNRLSLL